MEHVINTKIRNQAFWKFLIFFLVTIAIVVTAVYFDIDMPKQENGSLREKIKSYEMQADNQKDFVSDMENAKRLIDSMGKFGQFNALLDREIANHLNTLRDTKYLDSTLYPYMNQEIFMILCDYNKLNTNYLNSKDAKQQVDSLKRELEALLVRYNQAEQNLEMYRRINLN